MPNRRIGGSHTTTGCSPTQQMTLLPGSRFKLVELLGRSAVRGVRPARCPGNWPRHSITANANDWSRALSTFEIAPPSGAPANFLEVFPNIPCLKRHEINGNYYAIKKIPQQDQNLRSPLGKPHCHYGQKARWADTARVPGLGAGRRAFNFASVLPDNRPAHLPRFLASSSCVQHAQILILGLTDSIDRFLSHFLLDFG